MENKHLDKIENKLDKLDDRLDGMDKLLERCVISLEHHVKRTDQLEEHLKTVEAKVTETTKHVDNIKFLFSVIKWIGLPSLGSIILYVVQSQLRK